MALRKTTFCFFYIDMERKFTLIMVLLLQESENGLWYGHVNELSWYCNFMKSYRFCVNGIKVKGI